VIGYFVQYFNDDGKSSLGYLWAGILILLGFFIVFADTIQFETVRKG